MIDDARAHTGGAFHSHVFLGEAHESHERRTWMVIWLCAAMMVAEIGGGWLFGSIALIADGLHMSTHAGALLLAALAYAFARRHTQDERFTFGPGKLGDLAGFTSAIVLAMIALLIAYEAVGRLFFPVAIHFGEAIPIAALGLAVNVASAWLLSGGHDHHHHHHHAHAHDETMPVGEGALEIFEDGVRPRFRLHGVRGPARVETLRPDGSRQSFTLAERDGFLESLEDIPEPHAFRAFASFAGQTHEVLFSEHEHAQGAAAQDNNMRAALVHVVADAAVSVLVIGGLLLAWAFGWRFMDPLAGLVGAVVIASWSATLIRDTGAILLDMNPDRNLSARMRAALEEDGAQVADLHLWRLGPGHLGAIVCVVTEESRSEAEFRAKLAKFRALSHVTIEVRHAA